VHDVDELVVLRGRAVLQFEQLPAAVEELAREAAMGRFVHGIDGHVVHDSVPSFDQRLQAAERMLDLDRSQSEPALMTQQTVTLFLGAAVEQLADLEERELELPQHPDRLPAPHLIRAVPPIPTLRIHIRRAEQPQPVVAPQRPRTEARCVRERADRHQLVTHRPDAKRCPQVKVKPVADAVRHHLRSLAPTPERPRSTRCRSAGAVGGSATLSLRGWWPFRPVRRSGSRTRVR